MIKFRYQVQLEPSQHILQVEQGQTILQTALDAGYTVPHGCRQGICGACKAKKLQGQIRYHQTPQALTAAQQQQGYILCCLAKPISNCTLHWDPILAPGEFRLKTMNCNIQHIQVLPANLYQITLEIPSYESVEFHAGQYLSIILADGSERYFSIASSPLQLPLLQLHIQHIEGNPWTQQVIDAIQHSKRLKVALPYGKAYLQSNQRPILCIAGGTGMAPTHAILQTLHQQQDSRSITVIWGANSLENLYLHNELTTLAQQWPNFHYKPVLENATSDWTHTSGNVLSALQSCGLTTEQLQQMDIFIAGSENMVQAVYQHLQNLGLLREHIYSDMLDIAEQS